MQQPTHSQTSNRRRAVAAVAIGVALGLAAQSVGAEERRQPDEACPTAQYTELQQRLSRLEARVADIRVTRDRPLPSATSRSHAIGAPAEVARLAAVLGTSPESPDRRAEMQASLDRLTRNVPGNASLMLGLDCGMQVCRATFIHHSDADRRRWADNVASFLPVGATPVLQTDPNSNDTSLWVEFAEP